MSDMTVSFFNDVVISVRVKLRQHIEELTKRRKEGEGYISESYIKLLTDIYDSGATSTFVGFTFDAEEELKKRS